MVDMLDNYNDTSLNNIVFITSVSKVMEEVCFFPQFQKETWNLLHNGLPS